VPIPAARRPRPALSPQPHRRRFPPRSAAAPAPTPAARRLDRRRRRADAAQCCHHARLGGAPRGLLARSFLPSISFRGSLRWRVARRSSEQKYGRQTTPPERYERALEICAKDPGVGGVLILLAPQAVTDPTDTAQRLVPFAKIEGKPVLASWMGGADVHKGRSVLDAAGIATFDSPEAAVKAFLHLVQYRHSQELLYEQPAALPEDWRPDQSRARVLIGEVRKTGRTLLTEYEAKELLTCYGIPTVPTMIARSEDDAVREAQKLKVRPVIPISILKADGLLGVTVQPMVRAKGYELIVGSSVDPQFGPIILFGTGGVLVEVFQDRALGLPPLNRTLARRLMERTRIFPALQGIRGQAPVPLHELGMLLVRFSYLLCDFLDIQETDINPLLASPDGLLALDARIVLAPADQPRPKLTIEPYPNQHTTTWKLADGKEIVVRAIRAEDEPLIEAHHRILSEQSIRRRFFGLVKTLSRDSMIRLCHLDYAREMALVAEGDDDQGQRIIFGVSRYYMNPQTRAAEFAVIVSDAHQGHGLGQHLMERLIAVARERGVRQLVGSVLRDNGQMLSLAKELGFREPKSIDRDVVQVELD
jgi:acetyltransferase